MASDLNDTEIVVFSKARTGKVILAGMIMDPSQDQIAQDIAAKVAGRAVGGQQAERVRSALNTRPASRLDSKPTGFWPARQLRCLERIRFPCRRVAGDSRAAQHHAAPEPAPVRPSTQWGRDTRREKYSPHR